MKRSTTTEPHRPGGEPAAKVPTDLAASTGDAGAGARESVTPDVLPGPAPKAARPRSRRSIVVTQTPGASGEDAGEEIAEVEEMAEDYGEPAADGDLDLGGASGVDVEVVLDGEEGTVKELGERDASAILPAPAKSRLPSTRDSFQLYIKEASRYPLLKPEEEHELAVRFRDSRDPKAAFRLISSHLRLVVKIAIDFQRRWMQNVLDLVQEGNVGLMHALYKFDPDKGIKFSYYASFWIKAYILKFIMDNFRMVKIGTTQVQRKLFFNLNRERQKLVAEGFDPDAEMLSQRLGVSKADIQEMDQRLAAGDVSLNVPVGDESGSATRMDFLPAIGPAIEDSIATEEISGMLRGKIKTLLPSLSDKEIYILQHRLLSDAPETLREIGERFKVTRERVRQLEIRLLDKIKKHLSTDIKDFSDTWIQP